MCGITGIILTEEGKKNLSIASFLKDSLKRLEYRGYDSAGFATVENNKLSIKKDKGKIDEVHERLNMLTLKGSVGIAHTRWATHGGVNKVNAHPHTDCKDQICLVHNGIIENFLELREELVKLGHKFKSECDTEVIPHLIEEFLNQGLEYREAIINTLKKIHGSYAIVILNAQEPDKLYVARNESPLILGKSDKGFFAASDIPAFLPLSNQVIYIFDNEIAELSNSGVKIWNLEDPKNLIQREPVRIEWSFDMAKKGGMPHFMLKEIHEQPRAMRNTLAIDKNKIEGFCDCILKAQYIFITAAGTSFHASLAGKHLFSNLAGINLTPVISSEFEDSVGKLLNKESLIIAVSQSGETADTLNALKYARKKGAKIASITNVVGSSITRISDRVIITQAGPEIGVAATKTFIVQLISLSLIALKLAEKKKTLASDKIEEYRKGLVNIPKIVEKIIEFQEDYIKETADLYAINDNFFFLARGINVPTAKEGALKLKEISYSHAEAYAAGESKHGPIALVEPEFPIIFICPPDNTRDRILGNIMEMKARGAKIISVIEEGDYRIEQLSDVTFKIPHGSLDIFTPITYIIPLQLFAYFSAIRRGHDPDQPRNLAKSVTVL
ncbi:MAG: glutamine--fructose-6-phosphate transaminase (isomerizing) [Candidatus Helarchaeota archaeon]